MQWSPPINEALPSRFRVSNFSRVSCVLSVSVEIRRPLLVNFSLLNFRLRVILTFNSYGRGTFALGKELKAERRMICELRRQADNQSCKIRTIVQKASFDIKSSSTFAKDLQIQIAFRFSCTSLKSLVV